MATESTKINIRSGIAQFGEVNLVNQCWTDDSCSPDQEQKNLKAFLDHVNDFRKGDFVLICSDLSEAAQNVASLSMIPWCVVFDFDTNSSKTGLLFYCEQFLRNKTSLYITDWKDPEEVSEEKLIWCFARGNLDGNPETLLTDLRKWRRDAKCALSTQLQKLQEFADNNTKLKIVILWPDLNKDFNFLSELLSLLEEKFTNDIPEIILCVSSESNYCKDLQEKYSNLFKINLSLSTLCNSVGALFPEGYKKESKYQLPVADGSDNPSISNEKAKWLEESLEVLYLECPNMPAEDSMVNEIQDFYKGGTLQWSLRYRADHLDIEREKMWITLKKIKNAILYPKRPASFEICHEPGAGGTTFSQRILWELHRQYPCAELKLSRTHHSNLSQKLNFLCEKTKNTVILLVDGLDDSKLEHLFIDLKNTDTVVICVKQLPNPISEWPEKVHITYLHGIVSSREANNLVLTYRKSHIEKQRLNKLEALRRCVHEGKDCDLYQFGLTAYLEEFTGVRNFVYGYFQLSKNQDEKLLSWQKALGYLALAKYYGNVSLPCQFFAHLFNLPHDPFTLVDFPDAAKKFITIDNRPGQRKNIRICHHLVAKEILDLILGTGEKDSNEKGNRLSNAALLKLITLAKEFIEYANKGTIEDKMYTTITHILTKIFIIRNRSLEKQQMQMFSQILMDVDTCPPYTGRLEILELLVKFFPANPEFQAHVGRFYTYCQPEKEEEADRNFESALEKCVKNESEMRSSLAQIYMMYGSNCRRRIFEKIDKTKWDLQLINFALKICSLFQNCRDNLWDSSPSVTVALQKEIEVRVKILLSLKEKCYTQNDIVISFFNSNIYNVDILLNEYFNREEELGSSIQCTIGEYLKVLGSRNALEFVENLPDSVSKRRLRIIALKLQTKNLNLFGIEDVENPGIISAIESMSKRNIDEIIVHRNYGNKKFLDLDFSQWLLIIRHQTFSKEYTLVEVLKLVRSWHELEKTPLSNFYVFVLTSVLGFRFDCKFGNPDLLKMAENLQREMRNLQNLSRKYVHPREWIGDCSLSEIRRVIPKTQVRIIDCEKLRVEGRLLQVHTGKIISPNKMPWGYIKHDQSPTNILVSVSFYSRSEHLQGSQFANRKVSFILGFDEKKGMVAFNVQLCK